jgi:hypothetical protein
MTLQKFFDAIDDGDCIIVNENGNEIECSPLIMMADVIEVGMYNGQVYITVR